MSRNNRKAQIWISAVLYLLVTVVVMFIVLDAGIPLLNNMKDKSVFTRTKDNFVNLDQHIKKISFTEEGSQEVIPFEVTEGNLLFDENNVVWSMQTEAQVLEPNTKLESGNLYLVSDLDVSAKEYANHYVMQNSYISVRLNKTGTRDIWTDISADQLIESITYKLTGKTTTAGFKIRVWANDPSNPFPYNSTVGSNVTGYTEMLDTGMNLASATYTAYFNTTSLDYLVRITLNSLADYVVINVESA